MAHIRRHPEKSDSWQVRYCDPGGRERSRTFNRKVDAKRFLIAVEASKQRGEWVNPDLAATKVSDWADRWLASRSHLKPKTYAGYESLLRTRVLPTFGDARLDQIDPLWVETWVADLVEEDLSASRIRQGHQVLSAVLTAAVKNRYLPSNPAAGVSLPRLPRREMRFLDEYQVADLAEAIRPPFGTLVYVLAYGGLRWGEAAALRRSRVDVLRGRIEVKESLSESGGRLEWGPTKNYRDRVVVMPGFLRDHLNQHLVSVVDPSPDALIFTTTGRDYGETVYGAGRPLRHTNWYRRIWRPAVRAAGLPDQLRVHDLRHTSAALLIAEGAHPEKVKRHLGHSSITVTMDRYGHLFPSEDDALAQRLNERWRRSQADISRTRSRFGAAPADDAGPETVDGTELSSRWARQDSNLRTTDYESAALTN